CDLSRCNPPEWKSAQSELWASGTSAEKSFSPQAAEGGELPRWRLASWSPGSAAEPEPRPYVPLVSEICLQL
ncbi:unnamed protein product, partial [Polarella glacialis]